MFVSFLVKFLTVRTAVSVDVPTLHLCVMCTLSLLHVTLRSLVVGTKVSQPQWEHVRVVLQMNWIT